MSTTDPNPVAKPDEKTTIYAPDANNRVYALIQEWKEAEEGNEEDYDEVQQIWRF